MTGQIQATNEILDMIPTLVLSRRSIRLLLPTCVCVVVSFVSIHSHLAGGTTPSTERAALLLDSLETSVANAEWLRVHELRTAVRQLGPEAIPLLRERIAQEGVSRSVKINLFETLRQIPGEITTDTMLDLTLDNSDPELVRMAEAAIPRQYVLSRKLSDKEQAVLIARIRSDRGVAEKWAVILAHAEHIDQTQVLHAFVDRFAQAIDTNMEGRGTAQRGSYLSREGFEMGEFLWVFPSFDAAKSLPLLEDATGRAKDEEARRWWFMARGMSGDMEVSGELGAIVKSHAEDVSIRALALRAYAYALNDEAVPFLHAYVRDKTPGPSSFGAPLEIVAREQLARIEAR